MFGGNKKSFKIIKKPFLGLEVGDRITRVGESYETCGGMAVLNREENFKPYVTYAGYRYEKIHINSNEKNRIMLFQLRDEDTFEGALPTDNYFIGFIVLYDEKKNLYELKSPYDPEKMIVKLYKPKFKKYAEETDR